MSESPNLWAEGGTVTDPGTSVQLVGVSRGDPPEYDKINWLNQQQGRYVEALAQGMAGRAFLANRRIAGASPFDSDIARIRITYDPLAKRWFCTLSQSTGNDCIVYDSATGDVDDWTAGRVVDSVLSNDLNFTPVVSNGTIAVMGTDQYAKAWAGLDTSVAPTTTAFDSITAVRWMAYCEADSNFVAVGTDGVNGYIETSPDGITWTTRTTTVPNEPSCVVFSTGGDHGLVTFSDSTTTYYDSGGSTTWSQETTYLPGGALVAAYYDESIDSYISAYPGVFVGVASTGDTYTSGYGTGGAAWGGALYAAAHLYSSPYFSLSENSSTGVRSEITYAGGSTTANYVSMYYKHPTRETAEDDFEPKYTTSSRGGYWRGSRGRLIYIDQNDKLIISDYGADR